MHFKLNQSFPFSLLMYCEIFLLKREYVKKLILCCGKLGRRCFLQWRNLFSFVPTHRKSFNDKNAMPPLYNLFSSTKKLSPLKFYTFLNLNTRSSSANAYETKRSLYSWLLYRELHCRQRHQNVMDINRVNTWMIYLKRL